MEGAAVAVPRADWAATARDELADLESLWQDLDIPGHRIELIDGQLVVSPSASRWHSGAVYKLIDALIDLTRHQGWVIHTNLTVHIPATRERLIPDLMIAPPDAPGFGDDKLLAPGILLAAEVVSPSSQRQDRAAKPRAYAQGQVPLFLLIDPVADPAAVTLFSRPDEGRYRRRQACGSDGSLRVPEPFGITIDGKRLLT